MTDTPINMRDIAIVGFGVDLPGASDPRQYWQNLRDGVESIIHLTPEELRAAGETESRISHPDYVPLPPGWTGSIISMPSSSASAPRMPR